MHGAHARAHTGGVRPDILGQVWLAAGRAVRTNTNNQRVRRRTPSRFFVPPCLYMLAAIRRDRWQWSIETPSDCDLAWSVDLVPVIWWLWFDSDPSSFTLHLVPVIHQPQSVDLLPRLEVKHMQGSSSTKARVGVVLAALTAYMEITTATRRQGHAWMSRPSSWSLGEDKSSLAPHGVALVGVVGL
jgi:hypothetical protein